jgi:hypothetical protein
MNDKTLTSVKSLKSWTEKILADAGKKEMRLRFFIQDYNIEDFRKFYIELIPFMDRLATLDPEIFESLVRRYKENQEILNEAMKEYFLNQLFWNWLLNSLFMGRKADDLIKALNQIRSNAENIEYSLKLIIESEINS